MSAREVLILAGCATLLLAIAVIVLAAVVLAGRADREIDEMRERERR